eukprot:926023_1
MLSDRFSRRSSVSKAVIAQKKRFGRQQIQPPAEHVQELYQELLNKYQDVCARLEKQQLDFKRRQDSFQRREAAWRAQINALLSGQQVHDDAYSIGSIRNMHNHIQKNLTHIQEKTAQILQDQEQDLLRAFSTRLDAVHDELKHERGKSNSGSAEWVQKCHRLAEELDWIKEQAYKIEEENRSYSKSNTKLKANLKTYEEDRRFLIKQLLAQKKEAGALRETVAQMNDARKSAEAVERERVRRDMERGTRGVMRRKLRPQSAGAAGADSSFARLSRNRQMIALSPRPASARPASATAERSPDEQEMRYENIITHLKNQLLAETKSKRQLEIQLNSEIAQRTELQTFLRQCIEDVQNGILKHESEKWARVQRQRLMKLPGHARETGKQPTHPSSARPVSSGTRRVTQMRAKERAHVLELLFAQERVLSLLYYQAFPAQAQRESGAEQQSHQHSESWTRPEGEFDSQTEGQPPNVLFSEEEKRSLLGQSAVSLDPSNSRQQRSFSADAPTMSHFELKRLELSEDGSGTERARPWSTEPSPSGKVSSRRAGRMGRPKPQSGRSKSGAGAGSCVGASKKGREWVQTAPAVVSPRH